MGTTRKFTFSIRITVLGIFILLIGLTVGLALYLQYYFSHDLAGTAAKHSFLATSERVGERIQTLERQSARLVSVLSNLSEFEQYPDAASERHVRTLLAGMMEQNPNFYSIYVGYQSGDFFELINLESNEKVREPFQAAPHDRWVIIKIREQESGRKKVTVYLDQYFKVRTQRQEISDYDPRVRPWFTEAQKSPGTIKTRPYIFSLLKAPGVTFAKSMNGGQRVVAADISLAGMSAFLQKQHMLPGGETFLFDRDGTITASAIESTTVTAAAATTSLHLNEEEQSFLAANPIIKASNELDWPPFDFTMSGKPKGYSIDMLDLLAQKAGFRVEYINGFSWNELVELFKRGELDLLHSLMRNDERERMGIFSASYMPTTQAFVTRNGQPLPKSLRELEGKTVAIPKGWYTDIYLAAHYPKIKLLHVHSTLEALRAVAAGEAYATLDIESVLKFLISSYFFDSVQVGGEIAELSNTGKGGLHFLTRPEMPLLASILDKALAAVTEQERARLGEKWFGSGQRRAQSARTLGTLPHAGLLQLARSTGKSGNMQVMQIKGQEYFGYVAPIESLYGADKEFIGLLVPVKAVIGPYMEKVRVSLLVSLAWLLLLTPVIWYCTTLIVRPINALVQQSDKVKERRYDEVCVVESHITEIYGLSTSLVAMSGSICEYERSQRAMMDSFIQLIATAIDQKSPYTGAHCARVPELAILLARAASESNASAFASFAMESEDQWHEFRTAAWLHDCGKVATPEYIVDKATKLETIYNRIHEIRMRFEVLWRDAELDYWKGSCEGGDREILARSLKERQTVLKNDFAFVAQCNVGSEFMSEEARSRLQTIGRQSWVRHLDNRLGLGPLEVMRYEDEPVELPCSEPLLADKPEHIITRPKRGNENGKDFGFRMDKPENLFNLGELYNLSIVRGTLTAEDRYTINEHIITTIRMLETLPYPENMTRIPEYAGTHHETLLGTGYPRKLSAKDIGIPGRIMAIADVFEALTASDRPYKTAKTLSESVHILSTMVQEQCLDRDLFALFLESGIFLDYAHSFLAPEQIDTVDVAEILKTLEPQATV
nr:HD domain-containing phosphohydrolase [uncultured Desulfobulbus sp.]